MKFNSILGTLLLPLIASGTELLHYYNFDGGNEDLIGNSHGTAGIEVKTSEGFDGGAAVTFDSGLISGNPYDETGYVKLDPQISDLTGPISFTFWVQLAVDNTENPRGVFDFSGDGGDGPQSLFIQSGGNAGRLAFRIDGSGTSNAVSFIEVPEDESWFMIAATFTPGGELKVYLNGVLADTVSATNVTGVTWDSLQYFGAFNVNNNGTNRGLAGSLDDFALYSGILTASEIAQLHAKTLSPIAFRPVSDFVPIVIQTTEFDGEEFTLSFTTALDRPYRIFGGPDLSNSTTWPELSTGQIIGTGQVLTHTFQVVGNPSRLFLEVRED